MFGTGSLGKGWGCGGLADFWKIRSDSRDFLEDKAQIAFSMFVCAVGAISALETLQKRAI